jgi:hypothetical protein
MYSDSTEGKVVDDFLLLAPVIGESTAKYTYPFVDFLSAL